MHSALNPVQDVEVIFAEEVRALVSFFYTEFSTSVLKSLMLVRKSSKKAAQMSGFDSKFHPELGCNFFQNFLIDIEISVHVLHIVMILKRFDEANHRMSIAAFELDVILRNHGHA